MHGSLIITTKDEALQHLNFEKQIRQYSQQEMPVFVRSNRWVLKKLVKEMLEEEKLVDMGDYRDENDQVCQLFLEMDFYKENKGSFPSNDKKLMEN